jgi:hypothetical protein
MKVDCPSMRPLRRTVGVHSAGKLSVRYEINKEVFPTPLWRRDSQRAPRLTCCSTADLPVAYKDHLDSLHGCCFASLARQGTAVSSRDEQ